MARHWLLDPDVVYLNHGSVGATPRPVLDAQRDWRARIEREPVDFMANALVPELRAAADALAGFLGGDGEGLVFLDNATTAVNTVLAGIEWRPGDEVAVLRESYVGVRRALEWQAVRKGAVVRVADYPVPLDGPDAVAAALERVLGPRTRLAVLDHVTSTLAIVQPLARLAALCREQGVPVLVDGAHAPGMIPANLATLGIDWYAGNAHKWLYAPRGCGFLWTAPHARAATRPLVASVWHGEGYPREFDWTGTRDPSAWLASGAAIAFLRGVGEEAARDWMHEMACTAAARLAAHWNVAPAAPPGMTGAMAALPLPAAAPAGDDLARAVHDRLLAEHRIEVPIHRIGEALWLRISAQVYLAPEDPLRLADAVPAVLRACGLAPAA